MKILKVRIENYRQYRSLELDLSKNPDFVVIVGTNGFGKSNLLSAISWCLYGKESKAGKNLHYENSLVNFNTTEALKSGESCTVLVDLELELSDGQLASVRRTQVFAKSNEGRVTKATEQDFQVMHRAESLKGYEVIREPELWRDRRFPKRLESYFLFDGERLDGFLREDRASGVESAIMEIAQVDKLQHIRDRVENVRTDISREAGRATKDIRLKELQNTFEVEDQKLQLLTKAFEDQNAVTSQIIEQYDQAESIILQMAAESEEAERLKDLVEERNKLQAQEESSWDQFGNWASTAFPRLLLSSAVSETFDEIRERRESKTLPPKFTPEALEEILDSGECICGRKLSDHVDSKKHLQKLAENIALLSGSGKSLHEIWPFVEQLHIEGKQALETLEGFTNQFASRRSRLRELNEALPKIKPQEPSDKTDPLWRYRELQALHPESIAQRKLAESNKVRQEEIREKARVDLEKAMKNDQKLKATSRTLDFADKLLSETTAILGNWKKIVRQQVSDALSNEFAPMLPKEKFIKEVWIDENFMVQVRSETGNDVLDELSSGERQSLAFAFSFGLNNVSGYSLPMVIDTPFGRMGEKMKSQVSSALARNTQKTDASVAQQVIILMTDTEFSPDVAAKLDSRSPYLLRIKNDKGGTLSTIEEM